MPVPVKAGDVLAGKYRVERILGTGGMGVVVAARHLTLEQRVALKFMRRDTLADDDSVARFIREARAVVRLRGEHVARVFDVGTLDDGAPYIVMEYLDGRDLGAVLRARGPLPVPEAVDLVLGACVGLAEAHRQGIIHRDLKPQNLFLTKRPDGSPLVKVLDFGVSKLPRRGVAESGRETGSGALMGSPTYMAPEQMRSARDVDERADLWALGVILYELLSGEVPFDAETIAVLCAKVLGEAPRSLGETKSGLPPALVAIVDRCLKKNPAERFAHVADLATALAPFGTERARHLADSIHRIVALPRSLDDGEPVVDSMASTLGRTTRREAAGELQRRISTRILWPVVSAIVGVGIGVVVVATMRRGGTAVVPPPPVTATAQPAATPPPAPVVEALPAAMPDAGSVTSSAPPPAAPPTSTSHRHGKPPRATPGASTTTDPKPDTDPFATPR